MKRWNTRGKTRGAALAEYVVLLGVVGGFVIVAILQLGGGVAQVYDDLNQTVSDEVAEVVNPGGGGSGGGGGTPPTGAIILEVNAFYSVRCTDTYVTDIGEFVNAAVEDYFTNGGQVGLGDRWGINWTSFYEEGGDPLASMEAFYDRAIDWTSVSGWVLTGVDSGTTGYDLAFGPGYSTVLYNPHANGVYGWTDPSLSSCFEGTGTSTTYNLEAVDASGTILRLAMEVMGTN